MITAQLLGGACLRSGDVPLAGPPAQRHRLALLTLVVASWPQPVSRDRAVALLWPERDTGSARRLLNLAVHVLRATLGSDAIASAGDALIFGPARVRCDLHDLRAAIAAGDPARVAQLYAGPLLDGFHLPDSQEFGYWLDEQRGELVHAYVGALLAVAEGHERAGDLHGRVGACRRLVATDPYSSVYAQKLMRALDAAGDRAAALHYAHDYARRMRDELGLEPDAEVVALADRLRAATVPRQATEPGPTSRAPVASVAVLPFRAGFGGPDGEAFADGITEDIIAHLSKIRALKVISRTSVMHFRGRQHSLREIATALGASTLLDGSVRRDGDRVRIVAQLVDAATDRHLWAETYDRSIADVFAIQTEVALQIAGALRAELSADEHTRVRRDPTTDVQAYQLFLQGRRWLGTYTTESMLRGIEFFERALAHDPGFALAHAYIAMTYTQLAESGTIAPEVAFQRAADAVTTAMRLDPELGAAHCAMGHLRAVRDFDWVGAEAGFRRALELTPSSGEAYSLYGRLCAGLGRHDEAVALLGSAQELDPLAHRVDVATALLRAERYEEAVQRAENAVELDPGLERAHATLGWAYFLSGRRDEGIAELERAVAIDPADSMWLAQLGQAHAMAGNEGRAREILRELGERATHTWVSPYHFAYVYAGLGEDDLAIEHLERALASRTGPIYSIKGTFLFRSLRPHPRFRALLQAMRLE